MSSIDSRAALNERNGLPPARFASDLARRQSDLPAGHPAGPGYDTPRHGDSRTSELRPLTDVEHAEHIADVRARLADGRRAGLATNIEHTIDRKQRVWTAEREALQNALVTDLYEAASGVPCEYKAVVAGGLGGAGKTTVLTRHAGIDLTAYLVINPDDIKEEMARRGLIPHVEGLSPMEASDLVHEESSVISKRLAHKAQEEGKNVVWDVTMSTGNSTMRRVEALRSAGYGQVHGVFVDIPLEVSARRAEARHRESHDAYLAGRGLGGRYIAPEVIHCRADEEWGSQNRRNFEQVKDRFDAWLVYDNSVDYTDPVVIDSGGAHDSVGRRKAR